MGKQVTPSSTVARCGRSRLDDRRGSLEEPPPLSGRSRVALGPRRIFGLNSDSYTEYPELSLNLNELIYNTNTYIQTRIRIFGELPSEAFLRHPLNGQQQPGVRSAAAAAAASAGPAVAEQPLGSAGLSTPSRTLCYSLLSSSILSSFPGKRMARVSPFPLEHIMKGEPN